MPITLQSFSTVTKFFLIIIILITVYCCYFYLFIYLLIFAQGRARKGLLLWKDSKMYIMLSFTSSFLCSLVIATPNQKDL